MLLKGIVRSELPQPTIVKIRHLFHGTALGVQDQDSLLGLSYDARPQVYQCFPLEEGDGGGITPRALNNFGV